MSDHPQPEDLGTHITMTRRDYSELLRMASVVSELQHRMDNLHASGSSTLPSADSVHLPPREPRVSDPEYFDGNRQQLRNFVAQVRLVIQAQPSRFTTERQKVIFAATFLRGPAFSWLQPYLENSIPAPILDSLDVFFKELHGVFGDPDQSATAERQLCLLKQTRSAANYATDFRRLAALTSWNDPSLCFQFYNGLKNDVKDELARTDRPKDLSSLMSLAIKIDNRIYERLQEKRNTTSHFATRPPPPYPTTPHPATIPQTTPPSHAMEIDGTRVLRRPLTPQERQRRRDNNLCLYCGEAGHIAFDCPKRPQNRRPDTVSATTAFLNTPSDRDSGNIHAQRQ